MRGMQNSANFLCSLLLWWSLQNLILVLMYPCPDVPMSWCTHILMNPCPDVPMSWCTHVLMVLVGCAGGEGEMALLQEKPKKRPRKSRKGKLEESFPGYLQVRISELSYPRLFISPPHPTPSCPSPHPSSVTVTCGGVGVGDAGITLSICPSVSVWALSRRYCLNLL